MYHPDNGQRTGFCLGFFGWGRRSELKLMVGGGSAGEGYCFLGGSGGMAPPPPPPPPPPKFFVIHCF